MELEALKRADMEETVKAKVTVVCSIMLYTNRDLTLVQYQCQAETKDIGKCNQNRPGGRRNIIGRKHQHL